MKKYLLISTCISLPFILTGCIKDKHLKMNQSFEKIEKFQEKKQQAILEKIEEQKQEIDISIYNDSVKTILRKLTKKEGIPYFLVGNDLNLEDSIFKIKNIKDLQYYVLATTEYRVKVIDEYQKTRIKKVRIIKKNTENIFQKEIGMDFENQIKPIKILNDISKETKYTIITRPDVSELLNKKQTINFTGDTYKDFLDFFKNKYDVYIDIDNYEKTITIQKYKMETVNINVITDIVSEDKKDLTEDLEQSLNGISEMNN